MRRDKMVSEILGEEAALSPSDVCEKRFKRTVMRGYDVAEVDRYLERVADVLEDLIEQVRALKETAQEHKARIEEYRQMESTWRDALVSSQKFAEDTLAAARREAQALLEEAKLKRAKEAMEAQRLPEALARDIQALEQQRSRLRSETLSILDMHRHLLMTHLPEQPSYMPSSYTNINYLTHIAETAEAPEDGTAEPEAGPKLWLGDELPDEDEARQAVADDFDADDARADTAATSPERRNDTNDRSAIELEELESEDEGLSLDPLAAEDAPMAEPEEADESATEKLK